MTALDRMSTATGTDLDPPDAHTNTADAGGTEISTADAVRSAEEDFREFVTVRWSALVRTAYLLTGDRDRAQDLVQSALVRAHRHWPKIQREGTAEAYVRKTMTNLNTDWWRRLGSHERRVDSLPDRAMADDYAAFELRDELWGALQQLPARMRAALVLRYFEDLSEADTASALGCSVGSVKSQCSRGLARLRLSLRSAQ